jgi:hypothetical protein
MCDRCADLVRKAEAARGIGPKVAAWRELVLHKATEHERGSVSAETPAGLAPNAQRPGGAVKRDVEPVDFVK